MLLLRSDDVELNPGSDDQILLSVFETVRKLESGQAVILGELKGVKAKQVATYAEIKRLNDRVAALETTIASNSTAQVRMPENSTRHISDQLQQMTSRCNDTENRERRSNLLLFGLKDEPNEAWQAFERKLIDFGSEPLDVTMTSTQFERVHRISQFAPDKCRPVITKFTLFKDKQNILSSAHKLKGSTFSISHDFSVATRDARKKLLAFAKSQGKPYILPVDKLRINNDTCIYDTTTKTVVISSK